ncbi:MAG TPA: class II fructose-bisphosphate aldolase [Victivallales bacterium]|nr:class II fructose-bisphosphate aldolase [Victivallales bacterium]
MTYSERLLLCRKEKTAVLATNFYNVETLFGILRAAKECEKPVILQTSPSTLSYLGIDMAINIAKTAITEYGVEAYLHLDHAKDSKLVKTCIDKGFDSVMIDASEDKYEVNKRITREIVNYAHHRGVFVEAELGFVPKLGQESFGVDGYTDPIQAEDFAYETGVDFLAVSIGTAHGFYKKKPRLDLKRLEQIADRVSIPLVLHGGSGLTPKQWRETIIRGITKINFATEIKNTFMNSIRIEMNKSKDIDLRTVFPVGIKSVKHLVRDKIIICSKKNNKKVGARK